MDIAEICTQRLSMILASFYICGSCQVVDSDLERMRNGHKCRRCGNTQESAAESYFGIGVDNLIDLMQEFYHLAHNPDFLPGVPEEYKSSNHRTAVVIFFCSLGEVLLEHFLETYMVKMGIQSRVRKRLLEDSMFVRQRIEKLFPALTGSKWKDAIKAASARDSRDYDRTVKFYQRVVDARNKFLHRGNKYAIPKDMPEQCLRHTSPLVLLFVSLHNEYIAEPTSGDSSCVNEEAA